MPLKRFFSCFSEAIFFISKRIWPNSHWLSIKYPAKFVPQYLSSPKCTLNNAKWWGFCRNQFSSIPLQTHIEKGNSRISHIHTMWPESSSGTTIQPTYSSGSRLREGQICNYEELNRAHTQPIFSMRPLDALDETKKGGIFARKGTDEFAHSLGIHYIALCMEHDGTSTPYLWPGVG